MYLSASSDGRKPDASMRASTKLSIGFRIQAGLETVGGAGLRGGSNAQCRSNSAPASIQRLRIPTSSAVRRSPVGGMGFASAVTRAMTRLAALSPGISPTCPPVCPVAASCESSRKFAMRLCSSGPWHGKHFCRIGRTCVRKSGSSAAARPGAATSAPRTAARADAFRRIPAMSIRLRSIGLAP